MVQLNNNLYWRRVMKANQVIIDLAKFGNEKEVFVTVFRRDEDGNVLGKKRYPLSAVFSHGEHCNIFIEESSGVIEK